MVANVQITSIALAQISTDEACQARVAVRRTAVREYAEAMKEQRDQGELRFPPIVLFSDGERYHLGDGFHRVLAVREAGLDALPAEVHPGCQRAALLYALGANTAHGLPRTNADKRKAVSLMLADPDWSQRSDREIARHCQVTHPLVSQMRKSASGNDYQMQPRRVRRGGHVYEQKPCETEPAATNATANLVEQSTIPQPAKPTPLFDKLGIPVPELLRPVFATAAAFAEGESHFRILAALIDSLARQPGGEVYRQALGRTSADGRECFSSPELQAAREKLKAAEPYCASCPPCQLAHAGYSHPDCRTCGGRGWTTEPSYKSCPEEMRREFLRRQGISP
jgi:hypothetical protein